MNAERKHLRKRRGACVPALLACLITLPLVAGCVWVPVKVPVPPVLDRPAMAEAALRIMDEKDSLAAVLFLARQRDALAATQAFGDVSNHLYRKRRDLGAAVAFGRAGVQYGITTAVRVERRDPALAVALRSAAKAVCGSIASFTWPGGDEPGITITPQDLAAGMDAARANLRLAYELVQGHLAVSRAYWMLGAHRLAAGERDAARGMFEDAALHAAAVSARADELLAVASARLADVLDRPADPTRRRQFAEVDAQLRRLEGGEALARRLQAALRVFSNR